MHAYASREKTEKSNEKQNLTGIPTQTKTRFESLSGVSYDDVRVHYNSGKPTQLRALAYTKGTDVYIGPGQERHLGHELWHVAQQKQNRVRPAFEYGGARINLDPALEAEADAAGSASGAGTEAAPVQCAAGDTGVVQLRPVDEIVASVAQGAEYGGLNTAIGDIRADPGGSASEDITFGVELEVVHELISDAEDSVTAAKAANLTGTDKILPYGAKADSGWSPSHDSSLEYNKTSGAGVEWVSPILTASAATWQEIEALCNIIENNNGTVNDTCAEHVHVGHSPLKKQDKFANLFYIYREFQDVIDVFARSGHGEHKLRASADAASATKQGYAERMKAKEADEEADTVLDKDNDARLAAADKLQEHLDTIRMIIRNFQTEEDGDTLAALSAAEGGKAQALTKKMSGNDGQLQGLANKLRDEGLLGGEDTAFGPEIESAVFQDKGQGKAEKRALKPKLKTLLDILHMKEIYRGYKQEYGEVPLEHEERYKALNVQQNFDPVHRKPTVEFRRFNATVDPRVIQANVLLSTLIVKAAAEKDKGELEAYGGGANEFAQLENLIDLIAPGDDGVRTILVRAYLANLSAQEDADLRAQLPPQ